MKVHSIAPFIGLLSVAVVARAQPPATKPDPGAATVKATYLITGLHCPPCTNTVEASLHKVKGVRSVKVDWKTKNARIEFDEGVLSAQRLAQAIASTPHMMGGNMQYAGWLALQVPNIKDDATAKPATEALGKIEGVKKVVAYPAQHAVGVQFAKEGSVTSQQLIDALAKAGLKSSSY